MSTLLLIVMIASGALMSIAVLLMAPKGGLGFGLGGMGGSNEYGTKKSIESSLKKLATVGAILFVACSLLYPFSKPRTNIDSQAATGSAAPNFDLGNKTGTKVTTTVTSGSATGN